MQEHVDTVGQITDDEYVSVRSDTFVGIAVERFREFAPTDDETTIYYLYVTDPNDKLVGVLSLRELLNAPEDIEVSDVMGRISLRSMQVSTSNRQRCRSASLIFRQSQLSTTMACLWACFDRNQCWRLSKTKQPKTF